MTGLVRKATLLVAGGLLIAGVAGAGVPSPANSTVPGAINVVGSSLGLADSVAGKFSVVVRDLANNPLNGSSVVVDFSANADVKVCNPQLYPTYTLNCAGRTVRAATDASGTVSFTIVGGGVGSASVLVNNGGKIYADGVLLKNVTVGAYDLDGIGGVGTGDLSAWLTDFGSGIAYGRSDYDGSGGVGTGDLSLWLTVFGAAASTSSCSATCP
jgi:hypothetical protein